MFNFAMALVPVALQVQRCAFWFSRRDPCFDFFLETMPPMCKFFFVLLAGLLALPSFAAHSNALPREADATPRWSPPHGLEQIPIWPKGAPDMRDASYPAESVFQVKKIPGRHYTGIANVSAPTMTIFPPIGKNSGAAVVVFPGGGFHILAIDLEGSEICDWLTRKGITCVLLKYRVPKGNHYWDKTCKCHITPEVPLALQDAQRAIKLVRAIAKSLRVQPNKIGVIGFSAGGYLVAQTSSIFAATYAAVDESDVQSSRPDFAIALYPGHLCRAGSNFDPTIKVSAQTSPTFLLQAWDDPVDKVCNSTVYARALNDAGVPSEVHLFAQGGHAFGLRENSHPIASWPGMVEHWLRGLGVLAH